MPGTTDTVKAKLTPGEFVIRKEAVDMIGVPMLNKLNDMPEEGGHSAIDSLIQRATLSNMKMMYGGGMVQPNYAGGGMIEDEYMKGGKVKKGLKPVPQGNPGLGKLPEMVRNKMGYMEDGGLAGYREGGKVARNVFRGIGADLDKADLDMDDDMYTMKRVLSVPAEQVGGGSGLRYYAGEATADMMEPLKSMTFMDAASKMNISPQDSIPVAMIEQYLSPKKKKGLMGLLGFQDGGMIGPPVPPEMMGQAMNQQLGDSIDMRMANPQMGAIGMMRQESEAIEAAMKDNIARNSRLALQKIKVDSVMQMEPQGMSIPDSLITNPQSLDNGFLRLLQEMNQSKGVRIPRPSTLR
jgi:hypothetical protein